jgi:2-oxo-4-hydroxy-4-carboxy-5-ureidoimidazoline decarboxylase
MDDRNESTMDLRAFNTLPEAEARERLLTCLAVPRWADEVLAGRPYADPAGLADAASRAAATLSDTELEEALSRHPRIGEEASVGHDAAFSRREQAGVEGTDPAVAERLAEGNRAYEEKFGHVFLIRAAGRDATEILSELERRLSNDEGTERAETLGALRQIALLRLEQVVV